MSVNRLTLAFSGNDAHLEQPFLSWFSRHSLPQIRFATIAAIVSIDAFALLDALLLPSEKYFFWLLRFGVLTPILLLALVVSYIPRYVRFLQPLVVGGLIAAGASCVLMTATAPAPASFLYYAGIIQILVFGYTFARQRFVWASFAGLIVVTTYELTAALFVKLPFDILASNTFFLVSSNIMGMMACYAIEQNIRRDFYLAHKLAAEQENVRRANSELEIRVHERTADLRQINVNLAEEIADRKRLEEERLELERRLMHSQKLESLGVMAGGIAHDFNNILVSILGNAEIALRKIGGDDLSRKYFDRILASSERARLLVQQILTFSRRQATERRVMTLSSVVEEAVALVRPTLPGNITLSIKNQTSSSVIYADPTQIHQVVVNLCTNAIHAMEENGGTLEVREETTMILDEFADLLPGKYVVLRVKDGGKGIERAVLPRIFEPFFTTKEQGKGTGLGLSVVHGIVTSHGGTIHVDSTVGGGTTVSIFLPLHKEESKSVESAVVESQDSSARVLLVDDQESALETTSELLMALGYEVVTCTDPTEALGEFSTAPDAYDVVITDLTMPVMTGLDLAKAITALRPLTPVILATGYQINQSADALIQSGITQVLQKPFRVEQLSEAMQKATARQRRFKSEPQRPKR